MISPNDPGDSLLMSCCEMGGVPDILIVDGLAVYPGIAGNPMTCRGSDAFSGSGTAA
jgi:hypothetical protein